MGGASLIKEDSWSAYEKDGDANPVKVTTTPDSDACMKSSWMLAFLHQSLITKNHVFITGHLTPMFKALNLAMTTLTTKGMQKKWKKFVGKKNILGLSSSMKLKVKGKAGLKLKVKGKAG